MNMEIWKDIQGYEGLYQVSNLGRVKSLGNDKTKKEKILKQCKDNHGYPMVNLCKNSNQTRVRIHRLVAETFIPNPNNYPCVNHKDENPANNCVENLEWCDYKYNSNYGTGIQRRVANTDYKEVGRKNAEKQSKKVYQYTKDGNFVREWKSTMECERRNGYNSSHISNACVGRLKTYKGFIWTYDKNYIHKEIIYKRQSKPILQFTRDGNFVREWETAAEAERNGFNSCHVLECCKGKRKTHKGFIWKYK